MGPFLLTVRAPATSRPVMANARRVPDYSARRSGGDPENQRRRSGGTVAPSSYSAPSNGSNGVRPNPAVLRRKSVDYSARRAGGEEENNRRRGSGGYSALSNYSSSSHASSAPRGGVRANPSVLRRKSVDYSARRAGGEEENNRRRSGGGGGGYSAPAAQTSHASLGRSPAPRGNLVSPQVAKRKSIDYSARRSGSTRENARRSSSFSSPSSYASAGGSSAPRVNLVSPQVAKRKSIDYSARRSGATREEHRRRSSSSPPARSASSSSYSSSHSASTPAPKSNLVRPEVLKRRSADYSARRSGGRNQGRR